MKKLSLFLLLVCASLCWAASPGSLLPAGLKSPFPASPDPTGVKLSNGLNVDSSGYLLINAGGGTGYQLTNGLSLDSSGNLLVDCATGCSTGSGTITGVTAGTGLTGGGSSGSVTLNVNWAAPGAGLGSTTPQSGAFTTLSATSGITAVSDGVHAGISSLLGNTANPAIPSNSWGFLGPASASFTSWFIQPSSTGPSASCLPVLGGVSSFISAMTCTASPSITTVTTSADASIHGLTVGLGLASLSTNLAVGNGALAAITSGAANLGIGYQALNLDTTGSSNLAIGYTALAANVTTNSNVAVGDAALTADTAGFNIGVGTQALGSNVGGAANTAIGYQAGYTTTAGNANVSGNNNTWVGFDSGPGTSSQLSNATAIGYEALNTASNQVVLGNSSVTQVNSSGFMKGGNTVVLTADWSCGTGGTVSSCASATIIGSTVTPLTFTLPLVAATYHGDCDLVVGQATAATANQWNLLTATNGATSTTASYQMATGATAFAAGAVTDVSSTTSTFQITPSWTLGGTGTKMPVHIAFTVTGASASGTVLSLQLLAPTVGDLVTLYEGSGCSIHP